jgi:hypothetical protein
VLAACAFEGGKSPASGEGFQQVLEAAADRMIRFRQEYLPRRETAPFWEERYRQYKAQAEEGGAQGGAQ